MNANIWITIGIMCLAFSGFAIPYGFYLKSTGTQIESLKGINGLTREDEMAYKGIVTQIFNELKPHAKVRINDSIKGFNSNKDQKVDISIRSTIEDQDILTIIKTHAGDAPVDVPEIQELYTLLNDVRASKGIIISNAGSTSAAQHLAPSYGIEIYSIIDAQSIHWKDDIKIPVLYIKLIVHLNFQGEFFLEVGDSIPKDPSFLVVSFDEGKTSQTLMDLFISMWNKENLSRVANVIHNMDIGEKEIFILARESKWVKADKPLLTYKVEQQGFLHYFEPNEYRAIKNHLTGGIEPSKLIMKFKFIKEDEEAIKINDIDNFKLRTKGILVVLQDRMDNLGNITESKTSIDLIKEKDTP